jgi:multiple antibiotic resistance protein
MLDFALTALASILFVVDPLGALPGYLAMTTGDDARQRRRAATRATITAALTLAGFAGAGEAVFRKLGLSMPAFQVAGGVVLFVVALDMTRARRPTQETPAELREGKAKEDIGVTPLGVPMLAGPAAMSTVATLMSRAGSATEIGIIYVAIVITALASYLVLLLAEPLHRGLGRTGIHVFSRIMGLVLAGIAVQFVLDGLRAAGAIPIAHG